MRILGIDPGYAIVGFGILEAQRGQARLLRCGAINTQAGVPMPRRLLQIHEDLETLIKRFAPDVMAIEELFFNTNVTTGIGVAQARGVILMTAAQLGVTVYEYTPSQVKQAVVGYGKAEKRQVMDMTRRLLHMPHSAVLCETPSCSLPPRPIAQGWTRIPSRCCASCICMKRNSRSRVPARAF